MTAVAIVLNVLGGLLELAGLLLVVLEIGNDRTLAQRYLKRIEEVPPPAFYGSRGGGARAQLMDRYEMSQALPEEQVRLLGQKSERDMTAVIAASRQAILEERDRFHSFVRDLLQSGIGQRKLGAVLVGCGIVVGVVASVISSAS